MKALLLGVILAGMAGCSAETSLLLNRSVAVHRPDGGMGSGTIFRDGHRVLCLTAAHVVQGLTEVQVETFHHGQRYTAVVLREDVSLDLCLLEIKGAEALDYLQPWSAWDAKVGDPVTLVGCPYGELFCVIRSEVIKDQNDHQLLRGPVLPGMSGGPVFGRQGNVVGVMVQTSAGGQIGRMVPAARVKTFLRG